MECVFSWRGIAHFWWTSWTCRLDWGTRLVGLRTSWLETERKTNAQGTSLLHGNDVAMRFCLMWQKTARQISKSSRSGISFSVNDISYRFLSLLPHLALNSASSTIAAHILKWCWILLERYMQSFVFLTPMNRC